MRFALVFACLLVAASAFDLNQFKERFEQLKEQLGQLMEKGLQKGGLEKRGFDLSSLSSMLNGLDLNGLIDQLKTQFNLDEFSKREENEAAGMAAKLEKLQGYLEKIKSKIEERMSKEKRGPPPHVQVTGPNGKKFSLNLAKREAPHEIEVDGKKIQLDKREEPVEIEVDGKKIQLDKREPIHEIEVEGKKIQLDKREAVHEIEVDGKKIQLD